MAKHEYCVVTADFEIEPVVADYLKEYAGGFYTDCQIVFKCTDEHAEGEFSYIVILTINRDVKKQSRVGFHEFIEAHCIRTNHVAAMRVHRESFPVIEFKGISRPRYLFGTPKKTQGN